MNFNNTTGARVIIDAWSDEALSYALIIYPDNVLYLQWVSIEREQE